MEVDIAATSWRDLQRLRRQIRDGVRSSGVKDVEKLLVKGLADAIAAEHRRSDVMEGEVSDYELIVTVDLKVRRGRRTAPDPAKKRSVSSLMTELDDALASRASKDSIVW